MTITIRILNFIYCQIENYPEILVSKTEESCSYYEPNFKYNRLYINGLWNGKRKFFEYDRRYKLAVTFNSMIPNIISILSNNGYASNIKLIDETKRYSIKKLDYTTLFSEYENGKLRDYQQNAVNTLLDNCNGFLLASTGAGKSLCLAAIAETMNQNNRRGIFLAPRVDLINQLTELFKHLNIEHSLYVGSKKSDKGPAIISTFQTITRYPELCKELDYIVIDESHLSTAATIEKMMSNSCNHMQFRYGCTGSFPQNEYDQMLLKSLIGDPRTDIKASDLINQGYLSTINIQPIRLMPINIKDNIYTFTDWTSQCNMISTHPEILQGYVDIILTNHEIVGKNTLVLVNTIAMGEALAELIPETSFISGKHKSKDRKFVYDEFTPESKIIRIASTGIASTGISIDCIDLLILIDIGKSFAKTIQSIGRGLRRNEDKGKTHVEVIDLYTNTNINRNHIKIRKKYYKEAKYPTNKTKDIEFHDSILSN